MNYISENHNQIFVLIGYISLFGLCIHLSNELRRAYDDIHKLTLYNIELMKALINENEEKE